MTVKPPTVTAASVAAVDGVTATLSDVVWGLAVRMCPGTASEDDCPYCSGPETD